MRRYPHSAAEDLQGLSCQVHVHLLMHQRVRHAVVVPFHFNVVSPVFAPPDGNQAGFNGDYSGLAVDQSAKAHPIWSDTRNADPYTPANGLVHDEDVFSLTANVPDGVATASVGQIGHN